MDANFDKTRIVGSLKHGVSADSPKTLMIWAIVAVAFCSLGGIIGVILLSVYTALGSVNWGICAVGILAICVAVSLILFYFSKWVRKTVRNRKEIELWLEDAVMLKAYSTKIKEENTGIADAFTYEAPKYKISIGFKYNGSHYRYKSTVDTCWGKFCDKEIDILYSPKYREVILLKP